MQDEDAERIAPPSGTTNRPRRADVPPKRDLLRRTILRIQRYMVPNVRGAAPPPTSPGEVWRRLRRIGRLKDAHLRTELSDAIESLLAPHPAYDTVRRLLLGGFSPAQLEADRRKRIASLRPEDQALFRRVLMRATAVDRRTTRRSARARPPSTKTRSCGRASRGRLHRNPATRMLVPTLLSGMGRTRSKTHSMKRRNHVPHPLVSVAQFFFEHTMVEAPSAPFTYVVGSRLLLGKVPS